MRQAQLFVAAGVLLAGSVARAQDRPVPVRLTVRVGDSATAAAPIARFILMIQGDAGERIPAVTDGDGVVALALPAGEYRVESFEPYVWRGWRLRWSLPLSVRGDSAALDLTAANAIGGPPAPEGWTAIARGFGLAPGALARLTTLQGARYMATVLEVRPDTLWLRTTAPRIAVPIQSLATLEARHRNYGLGLAAGAATGLVAGVLLGDMGIYVLAGAALGLAFPIGTWELVPILRP